MIKHIKNARENYTFTFSHNKLGLLNALRRLFVGKYHTLYTINVISVSGENSLKYENVKKKFKFIYINNDIYDIPEVKFEIDIPTMEDDYSVIKSNSFKFSHETISNRIIRKKLQIRDDLYLFTLERGENITISGTINKQVGYIAGLFGYRIDPTTKDFNVGMNTLGNCSLYNVFMRSFDILLNKLEKIKTVESYIDENKITYLIPDNVGKNGLILEYIKHIMTKNINVYNSYLKSYPHDIYYKYTICCDDNKLLTSIMATTIRKCEDEIKMLMREIKLKLKNHKNVIQTY